MQKHFDIRSLTGLTEKDAARLFEAEGPNELPSSKPRRFWQIALDVACEPMFLMLVACGVLYLLLGDPEEAAMLLGFVFVVMGITFFQERKTERALEALRDLSSPRALVIRDGKERRIAGREVVPGDIMVLVEGDRVPADAVLLDALNLSADESLLTGESVPVRKTTLKGPTPDSMGKPGGDDLPFVFSGTLIVQGRACAQALATGGKTELGKIGKALEKVEDEQSPLKKETGRLVKTLALVGMSLCVVVILVYGFTRGNWTEGFLAGLTLAMAMLPEEFPVVLVIFLALGAWRISKKQVLTRRVPAVETLGTATVLCSDKTGTLTQNRMSVARIFNGKGFLDFTETAPDAGGSEQNEDFHELVEFSILASQSDPFDPMDKALKALGTAFLRGTEHLHTTWELVREYPLSPELLAISHVWKSPDGDSLVIAAKGSPEAIFDLCHLPAATKEKLAEGVTAMASDALRILGVARASFKSSKLPGNQHDFSFEFLGLVGFADPIRPAVPPAVQECRSSGIRVIMITGDYPGTAQKIARQIGIPSEGGVITGPELDAMGDEELTEKLAQVNLFARIVPEQKMKIVQALKRRGEIVAMTGDGVNDAPALKAAHIGVAMGERGTDVARESAALVLLNDDFSSIVAAVRLGRRIFDNIQKAMAYIFAVHVPIAGLSLLPVLLKWELILFPVHIVFMELLIDPACSVVFEMEPEEPGIMNRPPRPKDEPLFGKRRIILSVLQGVGVLLAVLAVFLGARDYYGMPIAACRALAFTTLIAGNLALIVVNRSWTISSLTSLATPNAAQWWVLGGGVLFLGLFLCIPFLQGLFKFAPVSPLAVSICFLAGILNLLWFEAFKFFQRNGKPLSNL